MKTWDKALKEVSSWGKPKNIIDKLILGLTQDNDMNIRAACAKKLGEAGVVNDKVTATLTRGLTDGENYVRIESVRALMALNFSNEKIISILKEYEGWYDYESGIFGCALVKFGHINEDSISRVVEGFLNLTEQSIQNECSEVLDEIGSMEVPRYLEKGLSSSDENTKHRCEEVIDGYKAVVYHWTEEMKNQKFEHLQAVAHAS
jgi:hypothetical protein